MNATAIEIAKLSLTPGDALVVMTPKPLTIEQRYAMTTMLRVAAGYNVPIAILDGGVTLATVNNADLVRPDERHMPCHRGHVGPMVPDFASLALTIEVWAKAHGQSPGDVMNMLAIGRHEFARGGRLPPNAACPVVHVAPR